MASFAWCRALPCVVAAVCCSAVSAQGPVDFSHEIEPVLRKHCIACHGGKEAKGSFSLNTRELLIDSGHVMVSSAENSELIRLITSADPETRMPPADRPPLTVEEQTLLRRWIDEGLAWEDGFSFAPAVWEPPLKPRRPELPAARNGREHPVDRILDTALASSRIETPAIIDDAAYFRRLSLDLVGLLPEPEKLHQFVENQDPQKRAKLVRQLLDDRVAYADHWLTFFNDLLRNDYSGTGFITGGRQQVSTWLYESLLNNKPFDQLTRELIAPPTPASQGYIDGIRWRGEVSAGQTVEIQFAQSIAQSFLGINMKCASCHDSFIDRWKLEEAYSLAAVYSSRPLEIHRCDKPIGKQATAGWLFPELGQVDAAAPREERLRQLAGLMTHPENGRFTRTIVNRLWYRLMGRGVVHPLDAMQSEPWNADLLDLLGVHLQDHNYNLKAVLEFIATSAAYQSVSAERIRSEENRPAAEWVFRGPLARRMTAEQFLDSVWQITSSGPTTMDAPVFRGIVDGTTTPPELQAKWIWGDSAREQSPPAGEIISLRHQFELADDVTIGGAVVTCDNSYVLYLNGREIQSGDDWTQPAGVALRGLLKKGENTIVIVATNAGNQPNPAGLFFEARMQLGNGQEITVASNDTWQWSTSTPRPREGRLGRLDGPWNPVTVVKAVSQWSEVLNSKGRQILAQAMSGNLRMVRASLMKNDFLMKSLGRPLREQIVSMRPEELTTLEAIDLSNGAVLAGYLNRGASALHAQWQHDRAGLIQYLYRYGLSRDPSAEELQAMLQACSDPVTPEEIEDLLWAIFMMPEFWLIR